MSVEQDVAIALAVSLSGVPYSLVYGTNCREGPVRKASDNQLLTGKVPHRCVFILSTTGEPDEPWQDGGLKTGRLKPGVQIWVRSDVQQYTNGLALAQAVWFAMDKTPPTGYQEARCSNSGPLYVREDDAGHHEWSINLILHKQV